VRDGKARTYIYTYAHTHRFLHKKRERGEREREIFSFLQVRLKSFLGQWTLGSNKEEFKLELFYKSLNIKVLVFKKYF